MFDIGSYVIYRSEGVFVVSDIREESFGSIGKPEKYYILTSVSSQSSTTFVPVNNEELTSYMRHLLSADQINDLVEKLRDQRLKWIDETRARSNYFRDVLSAGDPKELIVLVNTVNERVAAALERGRKPSSTDINALRRAERILFDQFSTTTELGSVQDIIPLLRGDIKAGKK